MPSRENASEQKKILGATGSNRSSKGKNWMEGMQMHWRTLTGSRRKENGAPTGIMLFKNKLTINSSFECGAHVLKF